MLNGLLMLGAVLEFFILKDSVAKTFALAGGACALVTWFLPVRDV